MREISLLYAVSDLVRQAGRGEQVLEFLIRVKDLTCWKKVDVHWAGENGVWKELPARYDRLAWAGVEIWRAGADFSDYREGCLPGRVRFALRYRTDSAEYWDNNDGRDYLLEPDGGIAGPARLTMAHIKYRQALERSQRTIPVRVAVSRSAGAHGVGVVWTVDNWRTLNETRCLRETRREGAGRLLGREKWQIWTCRLEIRDAYRAEYAVYCDAGNERIWDNNFGRNYLARRDRLKILTLNLHCYQEECQDEKFNRIARAIRDLNIDIVCLQEVCERWNEGKGDWHTNAARIIREKLDRQSRLHYHLHTDWSHVGFDVFREGCAILSRYRFLTVDSGYISKGASAYDIHSRKIVTARVHVPYMGFINIFSVHLSWWSDGFREQFRNLKHWADSVEKRNDAAVLLCGDFNAKAGSEGYALATGSGEYADQFLAVDVPQLYGRVFDRGIPDWNAFRDDPRIDYIFMKKGGKLKPVTARRIFTKSDYGRVSDHPGYLVEFELE